MEREGELNAFGSFFFNCDGMFCKVANELKNKSPMVKIETLHLVKGKIAYICISCAVSLKINGILQILEKYLVCID